MFSSLVRVHPLIFPFSSDALVDFELENSSNTLKITRLSNYITQVLETDDLKLMKSAASVLGM